MREFIGLGVTDQRTAVATSYGYDNIYQLLSATPSSGTAESYTYDPVGNRLSSAGVPSYSYNSSNELTSNSNATYGYDLNGNAVTKTDATGITTYAWDFENRLTSVTLPGSGGTVTFAYEPFGRRIKKVSSSGTSIFAYDGDNLIEEANASGTVVARYVQTESMDEPLAMLRLATTSYYEQDGLGTVTSLSNAAGALAQTYTFDSFGKTSASSGSLNNPFQFTGRELDSETMLYFMRARYFDPNAGRFLSEDPSGFNDGVNFYRYVHDDPIDNTDPLGLTTYKGFPADKEADLRNAVNEALKKLRDTCDGQSCAGKDGKKIANIVENATFLYHPKSKLCGHTGPVTFFQLRHTFGLGPAAFTPSCCSLASTLVHEVVHGMTHLSDKKPGQIEKDCFGCTVLE